MPRRVYALLFGLTLLARLWVLNEAAPGKALPNRVVGLPLKHGQAPIEQYAGHIRVREWKTSDGRDAHASLFYWYFPAIAPQADGGGPPPPLLLWIQGGPGASSMIGLFTEMGPLMFDDAGELVRRNLTWANEYDILFVDQPVGTGYSYVHPPQNYTMAQLQGAPLGDDDDDDEYSGRDGGAAATGIGDVGVPPFNMTHIEAIAKEVREFADRLPEPSWPKGLEQFRWLLGRRSPPGPSGGTSLLSGSADAYAGKQIWEPDASPRLKVSEGGDASEKRTFNIADSLDYNYHHYHSGDNGEGTPSPWEAIGLDPDDESGDYVDGYVTNMRAVGKDMWEFMQRFYDMYPHLRERDFYITSESYGGKYVPGIATYIDEMNNKLRQEGSDSDAGRVINLRGMAIGNSWVDPLAQVPLHGTLGLYMGLLGEREAAVVDALAFRAVNLTLGGELERATEARLDMFDYFKNVTGGVNWYDIRRGDRAYDRRAQNQFLNDADTKRKLHVDSEVEFKKDPGVYINLKADVMRSSMPLYPQLIEKYGVVLYQGQFDYRDGVVSNTAWIDRLKWARAEEFRRARREIWRVPDKYGGGLAGYRQRGGRLGHWVISRAGHMAPGDNPAACLDMLRSMVENQATTTSVSE
ncbi:hypothetical protein EV182_001322 [Spiromyces aspiralis]|uniref:Uncharacterized protein n=1 Tax=Spiromyces aspiralis TaxID=68401 RepID=A0ACC1HU10_9FUNG|nr:hypothetical protein EV182_001322 [Spiromyces aspiralis]